MNNFFNRDFDLNNFLSFYKLGDLYNFFYLCLYFNKFDNFFNFLDLDISRDLFDGFDIYRFFYLDDFLIWKGYLFDSLFDDLFLEDDLNWDLYFDYLC